MDAFLFQNNGIEFLPKFLTSLGIGLLIGLERERTPSAKAGLRTFTLVALLGTMAALLADKSGLPWLLATGWAVVGAMIIAAYVNSPTEENDPGTTTIAALLVCYGLGALVWYGQSTLAIMLAIATTALLYFKPELRGMTQRLTRRDLESILQFAVLTFVILPILPDRNYGPYGAFNPHHAWMMVVLISGLSLTGYVALRWARNGYGGAPLLGLFGGLVSSTATSLVYARYSRSNADMTRLSAAVILVANLVVLVRLGVIGSVVSPLILPRLLPVMGMGLLFGTVGILLGWKKQPPSDPLPMPETANPMELRAALGFAVLYSAVLLCSAWLSDLAGSKGLYTVALVSGLADVDAITLSSLHLLDLGKLDTGQAVDAIAIAYLANLVFKFGLALFIGGLPLARRIAAGFAAMAAGVGIGLAVF